MPMRALNFQDVVRNIKVGFFSKENTEALYGIEIFFLRLLENSVPGYWKLLEYSWNFTEKVWHEPCNFLFEHSCL